LRNNPNAMGFSGRMRFGSHPCIDA
jgi:hypothetical protein